jgi:hypothetical protein
MLITNKDEIYLKTALNLMPKIKIEENRPPIVNFYNPDIIILGDVNKEVIIPGDVEKIKRMAREEGIPLIIMAQDNILEIGLNEAFPLELINSKPSEEKDSVVPYNTDSALTPAEIQFGISQKYYQTKPNENVIIYAKTSTLGYPVITLSTYGKGEVIYYGLFDDKSEFKSDIFYPVFWKRIIDFLVGGKTASELNKQVGFIKDNPSRSKIKTPKGTSESGLVSFDYTGFYEFEDESMASNLITEEEQRLNRDNISLEQSQLAELSKEGVEETTEEDLSDLIVYIIAGLLFIELLYIKFRGDV